MKRGIELSWSYDYRDRPVLQIVKKRCKLTLAEIEDLLRYEDSQRWCGHYAIFLNCSEATVDGGGLERHGHERGKADHLHARGNGPQH